MQILEVPAFLEYWNKVHQRTMRVAKCAPSDQLDWTFADSKFTLGDLLRHIAATERYLFVETAAGGQSRYGGCGKELADGRDAVLAYMEEMHRDSVAIVSAFPPEHLHVKCSTPDGTPITVWKWLRAMIEHEIHHRGQVYLYLSLLGVPSPPLYGLTSEQVRERSIS